MRFPRPDPTQILIFLILLIGIAVRIMLYGDLRLSIAADDTDQYPASAQASITSWEIFTGRRLFTTNILYKLFEPEAGYKILANGSGGTTRRVLQPDFEKIAVLQALLSIGSWSFLAVTFSKFMKSPGLKIFSVVLILIFAFTPQIADWDSVLMSESLTFSLFALQLGILIRIIFPALDNNKVHPALITLWMVAFFLWVFLRDTNLYAVPVSIAILMALFLLPVFRGKRQIVALILLMACIFALGWITSKQSSRSTIELDHVYQIDLLPWPARVKILQSMGMPLPDSPEFEGWFRNHAMNTFIKFAISHPGYLMPKVGKDLLLAFGENTQTYFKIPELGDWRWITIEIGNAFHPQSITSLLISLLLLGAILYSGWRNTTFTSRGWALLAMWLFAIASMTIFISIIAGTYGLPRHALFSTMLYRLSMWLFLMIVLDLALDRNTGKNLEETI